MWLDWSRRAHRGLRTWILLMIQNEPKNGAEIMNLMESTSRGWWRPSPGSIYPMLAQLAEEGLIKKNSEGRYAITPQGKEEVEWPSRMQRGGPRSVDGIVEELSNYVSYLEDLSVAKDPRISASGPKIRSLGDRLSKVGGSS